MSDVKYTGWGYFVVFFIALVPVWHWYMRKKISAWDEHFATDEEKFIANRINKEVGYEGTFVGDILADSGNVDLGLVQQKIKKIHNCSGIGATFIAPFLWWLDIFVFL